ncbi:hypothetical protein LWI28_016887 [Acer negundo]|uniref:Uncharacterized protein n=1 Tax=Acer negundo TaxID=4023 RepID=A0AAD5NUV1_ACENE|nr:hypothetical protein LWI28_016887 [Acer negundo]
MKVETYNYDISYGSRCGFRQFSIQSFSSAVCRPQTMNAELFFACPTSVKTGFSFSLRSVTVTRRIEIYKPIMVDRSPNPKPVDHNWLVLLHPPGFCKIPAESCSNVARAETQQFTIHGLWPVDSRGRTIRGDPSKAPPVNLNDILADPILTNDLTQLWPNMSGGIEPYDDFGLWRDEWAKHGWLDPSYNYNALEYFRRTIAADKLEGAVVMESLRKKGIIPGNSYTLAQYRDAIESETKVLNSAVLQCYEDDGIFHLSENCVKPTFIEDRSAEEECSENQKSKGSQLVSLRPEPLLSKLAAPFVSRA